MIAAASAVRHTRSMEADAKSHRMAVRAAAAALAVLALGAALPIWKAHYVGPWEVTGEYTHLWTAVVQLPDSARIGHRSVWDAQWTNAMASLVLSALAGTTGVLVFRANRRSDVPDDQRDYKESSGGSIPDGQSEPPTG
jgi:hypothetical protein